MNVLVSVIMPFFNASKTIEESIKTILNQTFTGWELILIDDFSNDNTVEKVNPFLENNANKIFLIRNTSNYGVSKSRNIGVNYAKGKYLAFLDSDDLWEPDKLKLQIAFHTSNPKIKISHTDFSVFDSINVFNSKSKVNSQKISGCLTNTLYQSNVIGTLTVILEKSLFLQVNGFDENLKIAEDYDLWIRISYLAEEFGYINEKLSKYRLTEGSLTKNIKKYKLELNKFYNKHIKELESSKIKNNFKANYYQELGYGYVKNKNYKIALMCFKFGFLNFSKLTNKLRSLKNIIWIYKKQWI